MLNLNNIYNYYSTQIMWPKSYSKPQSHDTDDLKAVYKNMVKQNQKSPFYKFAFPYATQAFAIGIKETAMNLESDSKSLSKQGNENYEELTAVSDDENVVFASLSNQSYAEDLPNTLSIKVDSLATGQTNTGTYLPADESSFSPGDYSFGIAVGKNRYTFNINIHDGDTNQQIQRKLANSINNNNIGIRAGLRNNSIDGTNALILRSESVGKPNHDDLFFRFDESLLNNDITKALGVANVEISPANAEFYINDVFHTSISNRISLNHCVDLDLLSASDEPVNISLIPDEKKISDKLDDFVYSYNQLVDISRKGIRPKGATRLFHDVTGIARHHQSELSAVGVTIDENGYLNRTETTDSTTIRKLFDENSHFRKDIKRVTDRKSVV